MGAVPSGEDQLARIRSMEAIHALRRERPQATTRLKKGNRTQRLHKLRQLYGLTGMSNPPYFQLPTAVILSPVLRFSLRCASLTAVLRGANPFEHAAEQPQPAWSWSVRHRGQTSWPLPRLRFQ